MGKAKDSVNWFGEKGKAGADTVKIAGTAIGAVVALAVVGAVVGVAGGMFGGGN